MKKIEWYYSRDILPPSVKRCVIYYISALKSYHLNRFILSHGCIYEDADKRIYLYDSVNFTKTYFSELSLKYGFYWTHMSDTILANSSLLYSIYQDNSIEDKLRRISEKIIIENKIKNTLL